MTYQADTLDVLTEHEARAAVGFDGYERDAILSASVTAVSRMLDDRCGPVVRRTITEELHEGYRREIYLRHEPVTSFTLVQEADTGTVTTVALESFGSIPAEGFLPSQWQTSSAPFGGTLVRRSAGWDCLWERRVRVTYVAGRYADTETVDDRFKRAAVICLKNVWRDMQDSLAQVGEFTLPAASFPGFGFPNAARDMLRDELRTPGIA
jgi:hypothetical protein